MSAGHRSEMQSSLIAQLSQQMMSMLSMLSTLTSQRRLNKPADEADSDDAEEIALELEELRCWKRNAAAEQTRGMIERMDELMRRVSQLEDALASSCKCKRALCVRRSILAQDLLGVSGQLSSSLFTPTLQQQSQRGQSRRVVDHALKSRLCDTRRFGSRPHPQVQMHTSARCAHPTFIHTSNHTPSHSPLWSPKAGSLFTSVVVD